MNLKIRAEQPQDYASIHAVVDAAFDGMPYADGDEAELVSVLRDQSGLAISLVAIRDGELVGHIAFSPASAEDGSAPWFALGPVAVRPDLQGQGIGSDLINQGLALLIEQNATGCILTGNPNYYRRFGFELAPQNLPVGQPEDYFMVKRLSSHTPAGPINFHPAFNELS